MIRADRIEWVNVISHSLRERDGMGSGFLHRGSLAYVISRKAPGFFCVDDERYGTKKIGEDGVGGEPFVDRRALYIFVGGWDGGDAADHGAGGGAGD